MDKQRICEELREVQRRLAIMIEGKEYGNSWASPRLVGKAEKDSLAQSTMLMFDSIIKEIENGK